VAVDRKWFPGRPSDADGRRAIVDRLLTEPEFSGRIVALGETDV
jgi:hypothetical protein